MPIAKGQAHCANPGCGRIWDRDPVLEVTCPDCRAPIGVRCKRPSGHSGPFTELHASRDILADRLGTYGACPLERCGLANQPVQGAMPIEIIVGLPHLRRGALLRRASAMRTPVLVSANALARWRKHDGWREWTGWNYPMLANATGLASVDLDSAGYVAMQLHRGYPWTIDAYMELAASYPFRRFAALDWCCEAEIAGSRDEVRDRLSRTIAANRECRRRAEDLGIAHALMIVLQGRTPSDYERVADELALSMTPGGVVGVGSMCRRPVGGPDGLLAVVEHLDHKLPKGVMLHIFGAKGTALSHLRAFEHRVTSIDSQAYGVTARRDAYRRGISKTDEFVADHMVRWTHRQTKHASTPAPAFQSFLDLAPADHPSDDPWEQAIADAREEIRTLIETGALDHDEVTEPWIQEWAADLLHNDVDKGAEREVVYEHPR